MKVDLRLVEHYAELEAVRYGSASGQIGDTAEERTTKIVEDMELDEKMRANYERSRASMAHEAGKLIPPLQNRILRMHRLDRSWRWKYEAYELFCALEAQEIYVRTRRLKDRQIAADMLETVEDPLARLPWLSRKHTNRTIAYTLDLARELTLLTTARLDQLHGALAGVVGCNNYGCHQGGELGGPPMMAFLQRIVNPLGRRRGDFDETHMILSGMADSNIPVNNVFDAAFAGNGTIYRASAGCRCSFCAEHRSAYGTSPSRVYPGCSCPTCRERIGRREAALARRQTSEAMRTAVTTATTANQIGEMLRTDLGQQLYRASNQWGTSTNAVLDWSPSGLMTFTTTSTT